MKPIEIETMDKSLVHELDVRPILKSGGEPFSAIMGAISKTNNDGALRLRATFKPTPLFHALGSKGWQNWIEKGEGDDWIIWFYHSKDQNEKIEISKAEMKIAHLHKESAELREKLKAVGDKWLLDVRRMSPPEPMELTLEVLEKLPKGVTLIQINERIPQFLLPILLERGFKYEIDQKESSEEVHIIISKEAL